MKFFLLLLIQCTFAMSYAQTTVSGTIKTITGEPVQGANIYIENTYDGATSTVDGKFSFTTDAEGLVILKVSMIGYQTFTLQKEVTKLKDLAVVLQEAVNSLDAVVLSAGSFRAGDNSKVAVMDALDVVTTAGVAGDFFAALQTLPGTQTVGEDGRLFVRGGSAEETQVFIDGLNVFKPYIPTSSNNPTRGRYSPFLFDGITFSTGGYSAQYGNALSSVLLLNTIDAPKDTETNISLMSLGLGLGHTQKWEKDALSINLSYINLAPYNALVPDNTKWVKLPQAISGEAVYRHQFKEGLLKFYTGFDNTTFTTEEEDLDAEALQRFDLGNNNWYSNLSYEGLLGGRSKITTGLSYSHSRLAVGQNEFDLTNVEHAFHAKVMLKHDVSKVVNINYGVELMHTNFDEEIELKTSNDDLVNAFEAQLLSAFAESDLIFSDRFAGKFGLRLDHHTQVDQTRLAPRVSLAYRIKNGAQMSLAYGNFYQTPFNEILKYKAENEFQKASHYILNYQLQKPKQLLRAEVYYKNYSNLISYTDQIPGYFEQITNDGKGYASGIDLFWKDSKTIKNLEYWMSYSFLDTQRKFQNYPSQVMPSFATKHNASLVTKYWIDAWRSQLGITYNYASGRPYNNPNTQNFMAGRTADYHNLSLSFSYLISPQKILYFSATNVLGFNQVFGYDFARNANANGTFDSKAVVPNAKRGFFVGFFWTISTNKALNQLDNL